MILKRTFPFLLLLLLPACAGNPPVAPFQTASLKVSVAADADLRASFLGSTSHEIHYTVRNSSGIVKQGSVGPFPVSAAVTAGTYDFSIDNFTLDVTSVLSVQLDDAPVTLLNSPLAVGAVALGAGGAVGNPVAGDVNSPGTLPVVVQLGSVARNCYQANNWNTAWWYDFMTDNMGVSFTGDLSSYVNPGVPGPATLVDAGSPPVDSIAFMGNGKLVDFAYLPDQPSFFQNSFLAKGGPLAVDDVFCVKLKSVPGAHAWLQITNPGDGTLYQAAYFRYRVNTTLPYFAYERTIADVANACATLW